MLGSTTLCRKNRQGPSSDGDCGHGEPRRLSLRVGWAASAERSQQPLLGSPACLGAGACGSAAICCSCVTQAWGKFCHHFIIYQQGHRLELPSPRSDLSKLCVTWK